MLAAAAAAAAAARRCRRRHPVELRLALGLLLVLELHPRTRAARAQHAQGSGAVLYPTQDWVALPSWNALAAGDHTAQKTAAACRYHADTRSPPATIYSFNLHSGHCFVGGSTPAGAVLKGAGSDHVDSGCVRGAVSYCREHPGPSLLPTWAAPRPDPGKPLGGYAKAPQAFRALVHRGNKTLGSYNHNVMFEYLADLGFFMQWKNCPADEDCNGQRMLYATSGDAMAWAPAKVLFPNLTTAALPVALEPGPPLKINGRLYAAASPGLFKPGNPHDQDAQGSQFCLWPDPLTPRNCGPPTTVAVQYTDNLLLRRVLPNGAGLGPMFWAATSAPPLFAPVTAAFKIGTVGDMDGTTQQDIAGAHDGSPAEYDPACGPGSPLSAAQGTLKCEACRGGCQVYKDIDFGLRLANERTHYVAASAHTEVILYRSEDHHL